MMTIRCASGSIAISPKDYQGYEFGQDAGASLLFSPTGLDEDLARADLQELVHHCPLLLGVERTTWWLDGLRQYVPWLAPLSLSGVWQILKRWNIVYKGGRGHTHSPDEQYDQKCANVTRIKDLAQQAPGEVVMLYEDEITVYKRPVVGRSYQAKGSKGMKASGHDARARRIAACVDVATGAVIARQRDRFNVKEMYRFFSFVEKQYPDAKVIYIVLDNWPVHFHGYVRDHLSKRTSRIRLVSLPTYAPWLNPVEKLWLKLTREFLRQHPYGHEWERFKSMLTTWFKKHRLGSAHLLHEVGLLPS